MVQSAAGLVEHLAQRHVEEQDGDEERAEFIRIQCDLYRTYPQYEHDVPGVRLVGRYGANAQHTLFLVVEADDVDAIHKFLWPGFKRCTSTITPVSEVPVVKD